MLNSEEDLSRAEANLVDRQDQENLYGADWEPEFRG